MFHLAEICSFNRLIQGRCNVARVRVELDTLRSWSPWQRRLKPVFGPRSFWFIKHLVWVHFSENAEEMPNLTVIKKVSTSFWISLILRGLAGLQKSKIHCYARPQRNNSTWLLGNGLEGELIDYCYALQMCWERKSKFCYFFKTVFHLCLFMRWHTFSARMVNCDDFFSIDFFLVVLGYYNWFVYRLND